MKVLQLAKFYPPERGGMETTVHTLAEGLNAAGVRTDVLCAQRTARTSVESWPGGYEVVRAGSLGMLLSTSMSPALLQQARRRVPRVDLVHVHMPDPMAVLALRGSGLRGRLVVHWHSDVVRQQRALRLYEPLQRWLLARADAVVATSERYAAASAALQPWRDKVVVVPLGIGDNHARSRTDPGIDLRARHPGRRIVFALGRMAGYKGFDVLIEAAAELPQDTLVIIGGGGALLDPLRRRVAARGLTDRVILPGPIAEEDLSTYFSAADLFCLPSTTRAEAFGVAMLEAMAMGKPVVATDLAGSGVPWVNQHGLTGLNVAPGSAGALAAAIRAVLADPGAAARFGQAARARFEAEFTAQAMIRRVLDLYRRLGAH